MGLLVVVEFELSFVRSGAAIKAALELSSYSRILVRQISSNVKERTYLCSLRAPFGRKLVVWERFPERGELLSFRVLCFRMSIL
jgi:hypothetical protein